MKCNQCGYESQQDFAYCPSCGFAAPAPNVTASGVDAIGSALKDPLFLVLCILMSISCIFSLTAGSVPLINILLTVFLWLTYAQVKKGANPAKQLRCISGTVYAEYVIVYVVSALLLVIGLLCAFAFNTIISSGVDLEAIVAEYVELDEETIAMLPMIASVSGVVISVVFIVIAVIAALFNFFSLRYIHRFAKSVYQSVENNSLALVNLSAAKGWLIVMTVLSGLSFVGTFNDLTSQIAAVAAFGSTLIPVLLINKYFK